MLCDVYICVIKGTMGVTATHLCVTQNNLQSCEKLCSDKRTHNNTQHTYYLYIHTHRRLHTQGHADTPICSDKLQRETPVGLLFTFSHLKTTPIRAVLSRHAGKLTHIHSDLIVLHRHLHTDFEFCKHHMQLTHCSFKL